MHHGAVDGTTGIAGCTEDGFALEVGLGIIAEHRERVAEHLSGSG